MTHLARKFDDQAFAETNGTILDRDASHLNAVKRQIAVAQKLARELAAKCWTNEGRDALNGLADQLDDALADNITVPLDAMETELGMR